MHTSGLDMHLCLQNSCLLCRSNLYLSVLATNFCHQTRFLKHMKKFRSIILTLKRRKKKKKRCNNTPYLYKDKEHLVNKHSNGSSLHGSLHHGGATQSPAMLMPRIHLRKLLFRIVIIAVYCPGHYWWTP